MENVTVNLSFKKDLLEKIDKVAKLESRTRSELIREAARQYIESKCLSGKNYIYMDINPYKHEAVESYVMEIASKYEDYNGKRYTYKDYLQWPDDERWELIDGVPYNMSSSPSPKHQEIIIALGSQFYNYLKDKPCKVFVAPIDVRFLEENQSDEDVKTVLQPDIIVVCDSKKIDERGCKGAPDLIIEVISPHTVKKDIIRKFDTYEKFGVKEYWIIRPDEETVTVFILNDNNKYGRPEIYCKNDKIKVGIFDDLVIELSEIFKE